MNLTELNCWENKITELDISGCPQLEEINCSGNQITTLNLDKSEKLEVLTCIQNSLTELDLKGCPNLKTLNCSNNLLTNLDLTQNQKLEYLDISKNRLNKEKNEQEQDLTFLSHLINLRNLELWNWGKKDSAGNYNHFSGSLKPLRKLKNLSILGIDNTDIDSGLEWLPTDNLEKFNCWASPDWGYNKILNITNILDKMPGNVIKNIETIKEKAKTEAKDLLEEELNEKDKLISEKDKKIQQLEEKIKELEGKIQAQVEILPK